MKLYVAGPMSGYEGFNYPTFDRAAGRLTALGYEVLCPTAAEEFNDTGKPQTWDWYMRHALRMVLEAEGIALLDDWQASRGARLEVDVAHGLQIPVLPIARWQEKAAPMTFCPECGCSTPNGAHFSHCPQAGQSQDSSAVDGEL